MTRNRFIFIKGTKKMKKFAKKMAEFGQIYNQVRITDHRLVFSKPGEEEGSVWLDNNLT